MNVQAVNPSLDGQWKNSARRLFFETVLVTTQMHRDVNIFSVT